MTVSPRHSQYIKDSLQIALRKVKDLLAFKRKKKYVPYKYNWSWVSTTSLIFVYCESSWGISYNVVELYPIYFQEFEFSFPSDRHAVRHLITLCLVPTVANTNNVELGLDSL